jgi:hypothetical protein
MRSRFHAKIAFVKLVWLAVVLVIAGIPAANAQSLPAAEKRKIEALIARVGSLEDARFIRNDSTYSAGAAATFLRRKWQANQSSVHSAREFIDKVATFSGTSGKPYRIRFADGKETPSKVYLLGELEKIENSAAQAGKSLSVPESFQRGAVYFALRPIISRT